MSKLDYKKIYKDLYLPKAAPVLAEVPPMPFIMGDGRGAPKDQEYQQIIPVLMSVSYTIKMSGKHLDGYFDYSVPPLEGLWWCEGGPFDVEKREKWCWTSMVRLPEFATPEVFEWAIEVCRKKKPELAYSKVRYEVFDEGLSVQMMHKGPYAEEPETIAQIQEFIKENGLKDLTKEGNKKHHEIYIKDPNKTRPENLLTVIRYPVRKSTGTH